VKTRAAACSIRGASAAKSRYGSGVTQATLADGPWATQLLEIPDVMAARPELRATMRSLLEQHEIPVKVTEGGDRRVQRRAVLGALFDGALTLDAAIAQTELRLARDGSPHRDSNLVFARGWAKRLVHTHMSVLYSWAVLETLLAAGEARCFVPHSSAEAATSACSRLLAGHPHAAAVMRDRLVHCYVDKQPARAPLIPNHPHCTHVIAPPP
jgi:hypothetical protein